MQSKSQFNLRRTERYNLSKVPQINIKLYQVSSVKDDRINRVVTKRRLVNIDRCALMNAYRASDFTIESQIAIGADMRSTQLTPSPDVILEQLNFSLGDEK